MPQPDGANFKASPRILMVASVRDEGPFLLEWLAYHRLIGFTDFLIYSNDCSDGSDQILDRLETLGLVHHKPNPRRSGKAVQWQALNRASKSHLMRKVDWVMAVDLDEFVCINTGAGTLSDLFAARPDATGFLISWRMFGNAGISRFEDRPITAQFHRAAPDGLIWPWRAVQFKALFRADGTYKRLGVHRPRDPDPEKEAHSVWYDGSGHPIPGRRPGGMTLIPTTHPVYDLAQINHYALGSLESFIVKTARGRAVHQHESIQLGYFIDRNLCVFEDRRLDQRFGAKVAAAQAELLADPVLGALHEQAVAWRRRRFMELIQQPESFYLFSRLKQLGPTEVLSQKEQIHLFRQLMAIRSRLHQEKHNRPNTDDANA